MYLVRVQKYSMKVIKGLILVCFLGVSINSCFNPPEFTNSPEITYNKIEFKEVPGAGTNDSLILYINFKDGDGDLGLDPEDPFYSEEPYHPSYYYLTDPDCIGSPCDTTQVSTIIVYDTEGVPYVLLDSEGIPGKLVTNRTRNEPGYGNLPVYINGNCKYYSEDQLLVPATSADASYNISDTLTNSVGDLFFVIQEPFLYKQNVNHYNIEVKFEVFENGDWPEFHWSEFCLTYNGRFPVISGQSSALEGTLRYGMANPSFLALFSLKELRLKVKIRDRALNPSNEVTTQQFNLDRIRVN